MLGIKVRHCALGLQQNRSRPKVVVAGFDSSLHNTRTVSFPPDCRKHPSDVGNAINILEYAGVGKDLSIFFKPKMEAFCVRLINLLTGVMLLYNKHGASSHHDSM